MSLQGPSGNLSRVHDHLTTNRMSFEDHNHSVAPSSIIDYSIPGNRLYQDPSGTIKVREIGPGEIVGASIVRPMINLTMLGVTYLKGTIGLLNRLGSSIFPVAAAQTFDCKDGICHDDQGNRFIQDEWQEFYSTHPDSATEALEWLHRGSQAAMERRYSDAFNHHSESLKLREKLYGSDNGETMQSHNAVAFSLKELGRVDEAMEHLQKAIASGEKLKDSASAFELAQAYSSMGMCLVMKERQGEALEYFQKALKMEYHRPESKRIKADISKNMGVILFSFDRFEEALKYAKQAERLFTDIYGHTPDENIVESLQLAASCHENLKDLHSAYIQQGKAKDMRKKLYGTQPHLKVAESWYLYGIISYKLGINRYIVLGFLEEALSMRRQIYGTDDHPEIQNNLVWIDHVSKAKRPAAS